MPTGFFKIPQRSAPRGDISRDAERFAAMCSILSRAKWHDRTDSGVPLAPGEIRVSRGELARSWHKSDGWVRAVLLAMVRDGVLAKVSSEAMRERFPAFRSRRHGSVYLVIDPDLVPGRPAAPALAPDPPAGQAGLFADAPAKPQAKPKRKKSPAALAREQAAAEAKEEAIGVWTDARAEQNATGARAQFLTSYGKARADGNRDTWDEPMPTAAEITRIWNLQRSTTGYQQAGSHPVDFSRWINEGRWSTPRKAARSGWQNQGVVCTEEAMSQNQIEDDGLDDLFKDEVF